MNILYQQEKQDCAEEAAHGMKRWYGVDRNGLGRLGLRKRGECGVEKQMSNYLEQHTTRRLLPCHHRHLPKKRTTTSTYLYLENDITSPSISSRRTFSISRSIISKVFHATNISLFCVDQFVPRTSHIFPLDAQNEFTSNHTTADLATRGFESCISSSSHLPSDSVTADILCSRFEPHQTSSPKQPEVRNTIKEWKEARCAWNKYLVMTRLRQARMATGFDRLSTLALPTTVYRECMSETQAKAGKAP